MDLVLLSKTRFSVSFRTILYSFFIYIYEFSQFYQQCIVMLFPNETYLAIKYTQNTNKMQITITTKLNAFYFLNICFQLYQCNMTKDQVSHQNIFNFSSNCLLFNFCRTLVMILHEIPAFHFFFRTSLHMFHFLHFGKYQN